MDSSALAAVAFAVGTAGTTIKAVPQFLRTAVRGHVAGLSPTAVWVAFTAHLLWLCFGVAIQDWWFVAVGVVQTLLTAATLARFVHRTGRSQHARQAAVAIPSCAVFVALAATGGGLALEALGVALGVASGAPQLLYLWRRRRVATDVTGVSQAEYVIVITAQIAWTTYWLLRGHPLAASGAAWGGAARAMTLVLLKQQMSRARAVSS